MPKSPKQQFLEAFEREHERTMRVLRAYPATTRPTSGRTSAAAPPEKSRGRWSWVRNG